LSAGNVLFSSTSIPADQAGTLLDLPRQKANWKWMDFAVRRLQPRDTLRVTTVKEEAALVILGGSCVIDWGQGALEAGKRKNVFDGLPYTLYLPAFHEAVFTAKTVCEIAECRVATDARHEPRLITPQDVETGLRGGSNISRQIVNVMPPAFPAGKLVVIEVYTPGGNWSSFPPHKHDTHNPPHEVELDEIYYYRIARPSGFALQHLYTEQDQRGETVKARDGDAVLVRRGYHPVVAGPGYDVYYLNILAGSARSLAMTEDPQQTWIRSVWGEPDARLPLVRK